MELELHSVVLAPRLLIQPGPIFFESAKGKGRADGDDGGDDGEAHDEAHDEAHERGTRSRRSWCGCFQGHEGWRRSKRVRVDRNKQLFLQNPVRDCYTESGIA